MAQSITNGIFIEDFSYNGLSPTGQVQIRPPEFDYAGTVITNQGVVDCPHQIFTMHGGDWGDWDDDSGQPYGGPPSSNPTYIRFPVLTWGQSAGMFLSVQTTAPSVLTFDRSFSGYVGDYFHVLVNGVERLTVTGSAGYPWIRNSITLGRGVWSLAFVLSTANYGGSVGYVREGYPQSTPHYTDLFRYLRLTNVSITNVASLPVARSAQAVLQGVSTLTATGTKQVISGPVLIQGKAMLKAPVVLSGPIRFGGVATLASPNAYVAKLGKMSLQGTSAFMTTYTLGAHHFSDTGGFLVASRASLTVDSAIALQTSTLLRPLKRTTVAMSTPTIINGTPSTPIASCTTEVLTICTAAQSIRRIDPHSPANTVPVTPTWRWLSVDAEVDANTSELTEWHPTTYSGPVWSTPGAYRPTIDDFAIKIAGTMTKVRYPSIQFDAGHLDHLNTTLPTVPSTGAMTWVFIGAFARWRGQTNDNCPIIDYSPDAVIDYSPPIDYAADRGNYMPWIDPDNASSIYLGLTGYSIKDHTTSRVITRADDANQTFHRPDALTLGDATPAIVVYRLNGSTSSVSITPLVSGFNASTTASFGRTQADWTRRGFSLGKSRIRPPFEGSFLTGSMSLLEVSYYNRAISDTELTAIQNFYTALYAPVAGGVVEPDYTTGMLSVTDEALLFYAADPELPLVLLTGNKCVQLNVYPSSSAGRVEMDRFNKQGVPVVRVSNVDYANLLGEMTGESPS